MTALAIQYRELNRFLLVLRTRAIFDRVGGLVILGPLRRERRISHSGTAINVLGTHSLSSLINDQSTPVQFLARDRG